MNDLEIALQALLDLLTTGNVSKTPDSLQDNADFQRLVSYLTAVQQFAVSIAEGDLSQTLKEKGVMAGSLKSVQSGLRHLTWQTQRIAQGDFSQRVDFLGEFSAAFNSMVTALAAAQDAMEKRDAALSQANQKLVLKIAEQKQVETALRESEDKFRSVIEQSSDGLCLTDMNGIVVEWNGGMEQITGIPRTLALGRPLWDIQFQLAVEEVKQTPGLYERIRAVVIETLADRSGLPGVPTEKEIQRPDGTRRLLQILSWPIQTGKGVLYCSRMRDITASKQAENILRQYGRVVSATSDLIALVDRDGRYLMANEACLKALGKRAEEVLGHPLAEWMDAEALAQFVQPGLARALAGEPVQYDAWFEFGTLGRRFFNVTYSPYQDAQGVITGVVMSSRDTTLLWQAQAELQESAEQYRRLVEMSPDAVLVHQAGRVVYVNAMCVQLLAARRPEDLIGKPALELVHPDDAGLAANRQAAIYQGQRLDGFIEYRMVRLDGQLIDVTAASAPMLYRGAPAGQFVFQDITERRQTEQALLQSERRMADIIRFMPDATFVIDRAGTVIAWNRAIEEMTGVSAREMLGKGNYEYAIPFYHKRQPLLIDLLLHPVPEAEKRYSHLTRQEGTLTAEVHLPDVHGRELDLWATATVLYDAAGEVVGAIESLRDITERKRAQEEASRTQAFLDSIVEHIPIQIFVKDARDLRFVRWNRAGEEIVGYSREELLGKNDYDFFTKEEADFFTANDRQVLADGKLVDIPEEPIHTKDKGVRTLHTVKVPILGADGRPQYLLGISEDITERKRADDKLRQQNQYLATLHAITLNLLNRRSLDDLLQGVVEHGAELLDAPFVDIMLAEGDYLITRAHSNNQPLTVGERVGRDVAKLSWQAYDTRQPVQVEDSSAWSEHRSIYDPLGLKAVLGVPILAGDKCMGVMDWSRNEPDRPFTEDEIQIAVLFTGFVALMFDNAQLYAGLQEELAERKRVEAQLRQRSLAVEQSPVSIVITDTGGAIEYVNPKFTEVTGYTLQEALGQNPRIVKSSEKSAEDYRSMWGVITSGGTWRGEFHNKKKNGELYWEMASLSPITDSSGKITHFLAVKEDITDRKRAEERRATLYRAAQELSASMDREQICQAIHKAAAQVMPIDAVVITLQVNEGRELEDVYLFDAGRRWPNERYAFGPGLASHVIETGQSLCVADLAEAGRNQGIEWMSWGTPDAQSRSVVAVPLQLRGRIMGMLSMQSYAANRYTTEDQELLEQLGAYGAAAFENAHLFEETERRAEQMARLNRIGMSVTSGLDMEQVLQSLYDQCKQMVSIDSFYVALYDAETGVITFPLFRDMDNNVWKEPLHIEQRPGLTGSVIRSGKTLYLPDTLDPQEAGARPIIRTGQTPTRAYVGVPLVVHNEIIGVVSMQSYRPNAYTPEQINLLETVATQAAIAIENARLYTEARRAQQAAEHAQRLAEEARTAAEAANRAKSTFLANMSHELRTPLNAVLGFTELISQDVNLTPAQRENLGIVSRSGEHLLALINDVLEMSKIEAGRTELNPNEFDLYYMLRGLEEMFRLRAESSGLQLRVERGPEAPQRVRADEGKLRQVLINLLGNAVKFTARGSVTLRIQGVNVSPSGGGLQLGFEVEDTGIGIEPQHLEEIFDAFVQTAGGRHAQQGTGLGLAISRQYVRMMGGELLVTSQVGRGSRFWFSIPVEWALSTGSAMAAADLHQTVALVPGQTAPDGGAYRLLVVEDTQVSRQLLAGLLQSLGFQVREAVNGQEALEVWAEWKPHLIWMDMRMPVMDGHEATRRIKTAAAQAGERPIIVAVTASAFLEEQAHMLAEGCDDFVRKPFRQAEIFDVLTQRLGVQFTNSDTAMAPLAAEAGDVALDDLAAMPAGWLSELRRAVVQGDLDWITKLVYQIQENHPAMSDRLLELIHNFELKQILQAIDGTAA
ncbi:MAG: PAS domain S-box protein [Anaerolineae bacterium]